jgi:hypothetical protein
VNSENAVELRNYGPNNQIFFFQFFFSFFNRFAPFSGFSGISTTILLRKPGLFVSLSKWFLHFGMLRPKETWTWYSICSKMHPPSISRSKVAFFFTWNQSNFCPSSYKLIPFIFVSRSCRCNPSHRGSQKQSYRRGQSTLGERSFSGIHPLI